jgi:Rad3-related DNA helicase
LWIAAGASEGIDLAGDTARVNLIPVLPFANNREPLGAALFERDSYNYYLETAIQFIQQAGRTTRGIEDWSVTVCGDNRMSWLLRKVEKDLPRSFKEAIRWT